MREEDDLRLAGFPREFKDGAVIPQQDKALWLPQMCYYLSALHALLTCTPQELACLVIYMLSICPQQGTVLFQLEIACLNQNMFVCFSPLLRYEGDVVNKEGKSGPHIKEAHKIRGTCNVTQNVRRPELI